MIEELLNLSNDTGFYKLQNSKIPNIFDILKIQGKEEPISASLAWILDPRSSHGAGKAFLIRFIQECFKDNPSKLINLLKVDENFISVKTEYVLPSGRRIDIMIRDHVNKISIGIENKVYSSENNFQTLDYEKDFKLLFGDESYGLVYLVIDDNDYPESTEFVKMNHEVLLNAFKEIINIFNNLGSESIFFINQYIRSVNNCMGKSEEKELCEFLYKKYPNAVKLLVEHVSSMLTDQPQNLSKLIEERLAISGVFTSRKGRTGQNYWLAVYPQEWIEHFGSDKWSNVHHEFQFIKDKLYLTFHTENGYGKKGIKKYNTIEVGTFDKDNIDNVAEEAVKLLNEKHSEILSYIQSFY